MSNINIDGTYIVTHPIKVGEDKNHSDKKVFYLIAIKFGKLCFYLRS